MACQHGRGRILTYDAGPYRWLEECSLCGALRGCTSDNMLVDMIDRGETAIPVPSQPHEPISSRVARYKAKCGLN